MAARAPEDIHALIEAAVNAGDLDAFLGLHEDGAITVNPADGRQVRGRAEIRAALAPLFAAGPEVRIEFLDKVQGDELALSHARVHLVGTNPGGAALDVHGRGTVVSRRQQDGSWRIVLDNPMSPA